MKTFIEENGKTIFAIVCTVLTIVLLVAIFSNQLAPFLKNAYTTQEHLQNRVSVGEEGSKVDSNKSRADAVAGQTAYITFNNPQYNSENVEADVNGINLMIREKEYELPLSAGGTYKFTGSEWYAFNNKFSNYGLETASTSRPFYILSLNPLSSGLASATATTRSEMINASTSFNDITTVSFNFPQKKNEAGNNIKGYILITFERDASGNILMDSQKRPIVKKYSEVNSLSYSKADGKTLKSLDADFDVIVFKEPGVYRIRYFLTDKAGYNYDTYSKITVDKVYGAIEDSKYEQLWKLI